MQPDVDRMVEFIRAQIDADERLAKAAVITAHDGPNAYQPHPELSAWRYVPDGEVEYVSTPEMVAHEHHEPYRVACDSEGILPAVDEKVGPHIARQDPASTLARVAAHRAILDDILAEKHLVVEDDCWYTCRAATEDRDGGETCNDEERGGPCDCGRDARVARMVRHLATMYAGREGFDASWRPA